MNPYLLQAGQQGLAGLGEYFMGAEQRKQDRWKFGQTKDLYDLIRWQMLGRDVVSQSDVSGMQNRMHTALGPTRAAMSHAASRFGGMRSGQAHNMFQQNYLPVESDMMAKLQQWAKSMNVQSNQNLLGLLSGLRA